MRGPSVTGLREFLKWCCTSNLTLNHPAGQGCKCAQGVLMKEHSHVHAHACPSMQKGALCFDVLLLCLGQAKTK